jgi:D-glycero-beta-D-manno-heptose 1-phosphate adenylyltransferase
MRYIKLPLQEKSFQQESLKKYIEKNKIPILCDHLRKEKKTIGTINGSFDLLHAGHLEILYQASRQADVLFVLLNSDSSIKKYKSIHRPIISLTARMQMVAALYFVSYVSFFEETDPTKILALIRPDVHVNGSEYGKDCIERKVVENHGGKIYIVDLVQGLSTSQIIQKIIDAHHCKI